MRRPVLLLAVMLAGTPAAATCTDLDGDGYYYEEGCGEFADCDDTDPSVHPGAADYCNDIDEDCDGVLEESCPELWVDCDDGDDGNDGRTAASPKRTLTGAIGGHAFEAPVELHVMPGTCPAEGPLTLPRNTTVLGSGRDATVLLTVFDTYDLNSLCRGDCNYLFRDLTMTSFDGTYTCANLSFYNVRGTGGVSMRCFEEGEASVFLFESDFGWINHYGPGALGIVSSRVGSTDLGFYEPVGGSIAESLVGGVVLYDGNVDISGGTVGGVHNQAPWGVVSIGGTVVEGSVSHFSDYYGRIDIAGCTVTGNIHNESQSGVLSMWDTVVEGAVILGGRDGRLDIDRCTVTGYIRNEGESGALSMSNTVVEGGPVIFDGQYGSSIGDLESNTFAAMEGDAIRIAGSVDLHLSGNAFVDIGGAAIRQVYPVNATYDIQRNNFDSVGDVFCVEQDGCTLPAGNFTFPSGFVPGHYWLTSSSPLIDLGDGLETSDRDGFPRPTDGNGDGVAVNDIGAYEFNDPDQDALDTRADNCPDVPNPNQADGDADGSGDACDNCHLVANPLQEDADTDLVGDVCDNCAVVVNADQTDTDTDGLGDVCDNCSGIGNQDQTDTDADGLGDVCDNCRFASNPSQIDQDGDGRGNVCDNCTTAYNPDQLDADTDSIGNACDNCLTVANPAQTDTDGDLRGNACDNCPLSYNPFQDDWDADRAGDVCDNCLFDYNQTQSDFNADNQGDFCDLDDGLIYLFNTGDPNYVEWQSEEGFTAWNVYRGDLAVLKATGVYTQAPGSNPLAARTADITVPWLQDVDPVAMGKTAFYLVTGMSNGIESSLGTDSHGNERPFGPGIVFDSATASSDLFPISGSLTVSYSHNVGAELGEALLLVFINGKQGPGGAMANCRAASVTYAGAALTPAGMASAVDASDFKTVVEAWYLVGPAPGAGVVQMTFPGECTAVQSDALSLGNVDQSAPIRGTASSTITASQACTVATLIVSGAGGWAIDAFAYNRSLDATPQFVEQTERADYHSSVVGGSLESSTRPAGASPLTLGWNVGSAPCGRAVHLVVAIGPS